MNTATFEWKIEIKHLRFIINERYTAAELSESIDGKEFYG
jgi:hypothetical protein